MAIHQTKGATHAGWRLMGLDGTTLDLPDTPANARTFGRPGGGRADGAFPQVRLLALCELGTHAVCGLAIKPLRHGEPSMVGQLLEQLGPGMLLIWVGASSATSWSARSARVAPTCWPGPSPTADWTRCVGSTTGHTRPSSTPARSTVIAIPTA